MIFWSDIISINSISVVYYDGKGNQGWPGFFNNANNTQREFDTGINNAGPYRINIFGVHEPK